MEWLEYMLAGELDSTTLSLIRRMVLGDNLCRFNSCTAKVSQRLMSGALWTSSSNGVLNLFIMSYLAGRSQQPDMPAVLLARRIKEFFRGFVEGDDGICEAYDLDGSLITELGLNLKLERADHFTEASFCGIVCDADELRIVTDPKKILRNIFHFSDQRGTTMSGRLDRKHNALLRAKAMSYAYAYSDCPVVGRLVHEICRATSGIDVRGVKLDSQIKQFWLEQCSRENRHRKEPEVSMASRLIVEKRFGVPVSLQLLLEESFKSFELYTSVPVPTYLLLTPLDIEHAECFTQHTHQPHQGEIDADLVLAVNGCLKGKKNGLAKAQKKLFPKDSLFTVPSGERDIYLPLA